MFTLSFSFLFLCYCNTLASLQFSHSNKFLNQRDSNSNQLFATHSFRLNSWWWGSCRSYFTLSCISYWSPFHADIKNLMPIFIFSVAIHVVHAVKSVTHNQILSLSLSLYQHDDPFFFRVYLSLSLFLPNTQIIELSQSFVVWFPSFLSSLSLSSLTKWHALKHQITARDCLLRWKHSFDITVSRSNTFRNHWSDFIEWNLTESFDEIAPF